MNIDQSLQHVFQMVAPEAALLGAACVLFIASTMRGVGRACTALVALAGIAGALCLHFAGREPTGLVSTVSAVWPDRLAAFVRIAALVIGALFILVSWSESDVTRAADFAGCLLVATAGLSIVGRANDLLAMYVALELISIPTYVMLYLPRASHEASQEAALKYFMLSVMSSAVMIFGFSYLYGVAGTTNISALMQLLPRFAASDSALSILIAMTLTLVGLGFRVTVFPFHFYAPDVYQGGPTTTVAFLSFVPKVAGFVVMLRLFAFVGDARLVAGEFTKQIMILFWILAVASMTVGNIMALLQSNIRRMLAYSSIANGGYLLIGIAVIPAQSYMVGGQGVLVPGGEALLFYLVAYGAMTTGAFAVLSYLETPDQRAETFDDVAGLYGTRPSAAVLLGVFLLSMIGLPLTAGFVGKLLLFVAAMDTPSAAPMGDLFRVLAGIAALNAAVAAYYYLRLLTIVFFRTSLTPAMGRGRLSPLLVALICAAVTVAFGIYPAPLKNACAWAVSGLS